MTIQEALLILKISGAIIGLLIGVLGFFLKLQINTIIKLRDSVTRLETIEVERKTQCSSFHLIIDKRLDAFANDIKSHEMRINKLESTHR